MLMMPNENNKYKLPPIVLPAISYKPQQQQQPKVRLPSFTETLQTLHNDALPNMFISSIRRDSIATTSSTLTSSSGSYYVSDSMSSVPSSPESVSVKVKKPSRKRKKSLCPECNKLVSNLVTHKSTHLSDEAKIHVCSNCHRSFTRLNDLQRHTKLHSKENFLQNSNVSSNTEVFQCPYWSCGFNSCHQTGVFSRVDTFKNHIKALHFTYPKGTKKSERSRVPGHCKACERSFESVSEWLDYHVMTGECTSIIKKS